MMPVAESGCVLVVDDDHSLRKLMSKVLRRAGLATDEASDGAEAIRLLGERDYAVLILDLLMPNVCGQGVIQYLNDRLPIPPPIVVVVSAEQETVLRGLDDSIVTMFLQKPVDMASMLAVVESVHELTHSH